METKGFSFFLIFIRTCPEKLDTAIGIPWLREPYVIDSTWSRVEAIGAKPSSTTPGNLGRKTFPAPDKRRQSDFRAGGECGESSEMPGEALRVLPLQMSRKHQESDWRLLSGAGKVLRPRFPGVVLDGFAPIASTRDHVESITYGSRSHGIPIAVSSFSGHVRMKIKKKEKPFVSIYTRFIFAFSHLQQSGHLRRVLCQVILKSYRR
jgi:hypothetical protein